MPESAPTGTGIFSDSLGLAGTGVGDKGFTLGWSPEVVLLGSTETPRIDACCPVVEGIGPSTIERPLFKVSCASGSIAHASASAAASKDAIGKRVARSFAIARKITSERAGGIFGLMSIGGVGKVLIWCFIIAAELSPWNGKTPVQSS